MSMPTLSCQTTSFEVISHHLAIIEESIFHLSTAMLNPRGAAMTGQGGWFHERIGLAICMLEAMSGFHSSTAATPQDPFEAALEAVARGTKFSSN